jgi:hypothetical protein
VFVLTYLATYDGDTPPAYSHEHNELVLVRPDDVGDLHIPEDYKTAIFQAVERGHFESPPPRGASSGATAR